MADPIGRSTHFPTELVREIVNTVAATSALAQMCAAKPIAFNGTSIFTFAMDNEVDLVAENGVKSPGGGAIEPVTITPVKVEYGMRVSDEFIYASESARMDILGAFADGFAAKTARGLDLMAMHGVNPRTGDVADTIVNRSFDTKTTQSVSVGENTPNENIEAAVALVEGSGFEVDGLIMATMFRSELAAQTANGLPLYPQLAWGATPKELNGLKVAATSAVSANSSTDRALIGDFGRYFRWGYAADMPIEVIRYGNPDNDTTQGDLRGRNQIYLRGEAFIGWGILAPNAFAWIKS